MVKGRAGIAALVDEAEAVVRVSVVGQPVPKIGKGFATVEFAWSAEGPQREARQGRIRCTLARSASAWLVRTLHNEER